MLSRIPEEYIKKFEQDNKIGLLATRDHEGYPHLTLISSLQARNDRELIWGQFSEGMSKKNVLENPKTGFLILNFDKEMWRGKVVWTHMESVGPEFDIFNEKPLFRYNSYFGIGKAHYMDLVEISNKAVLNMLSIGTGAVLSKLVKPAYRRNDIGRILKPFAEKIFNKFDSLKFISYIDSDGFPVIIPIIQAQSADSGRIVFSLKPYGSELRNIPEGTNAAIFCTTMNLEFVLVKGSFKGVRKLGGIHTGVLDIEKVYNSMIPRSGYIYPREELKAVTEFK
mgnify:CR=1 FL=1